MTGDATARSFLFVMPRYLPAQGGAERYWQVLAERAAADGNRVQVYTTNALDIELFWEPGRAAIGAPTETMNGVQVQRFPVQPVPPFPRGYRGVRRVLAEASDMGAPLALLKMLAARAPYCPALPQALNELRERFDLVVGVNIVYESLLFGALDYAKRVGAPFVLCPFTHLGVAGDRSIARFYTMRHQIWLAQQSDAVLVSTPGEADYLAEHGIARSKLVLLGTGIEPQNSLGGDGARARAKFNLKGKVVLFVGTLSADKGATHAVEALREVSNAMLVLVGSALSDFKSFYAAQPPEVQARCRLAGFVSEEDKRDLLAACDVLVLPSQTDLFPTVFLEAWLYGKPVIGARAGGIPDVIEDEQDGLLVAFGDVGGLAKAIRRVLNDEPLAQRLGERGREKVYAKFTWERLYARVAALFARLVERKPITDLSYASAEPPHA